MLRIGPFVLGQCSIWKRVHSTCTYGLTSECLWWTISNGYNNKLTSFCIYLDSILRLQLLCCDFMFVNLQALPWLPIRIPQSAWILSVLEQRRFHDWVEKIPHVLPLLVLRPRDLGGPHSLDYVLSYCPAVNSSSLCSYSCYLHVKQFSVFKYSALGMFSKL